MKTEEVLNMDNGLMFQGFEWYIPDDGNYYKDLKKKLVDLKRIGVTSIWLPPVCKATGTGDTGYGIYDLYDLGEFDQKGSVRTKYGTKEELLDLIKAIHEEGMHVYADVVLNHKAGADFEEEFEAVKVDSEDRTKDIEEPRKIKAWTGFDFPGRNGKYSDFTWNYNHFSGVDYDSITGETGIFRILGENKGWNWGVSHDNGNFDYLMFSDIDHAHPDVIEELKRWVDWFIEELDLDGIRFDAVKHIDSAFLDDFTNHIKEKMGEEFYLLGEYWEHNLENKTKFMKSTKFSMDLFDVGLHFNINSASKDAENYDLRTIFDETITKENPPMSVTFVDNHDSEPGQSLESFVEPWFKEIAYGIILLRKDGYPCIFYGDYYGIGGEYMIEPHKERIDTLALIRKHHAYGEQEDYFTEKDLIGWVRHGNEDHPGKCAVVISTLEKKSISMFMGEDQSGRVFKDFTGNCEDQVTINEEGYGEFPAEAGSISVWLEEGIDLG